MSDVILCSIGFALGVAFGTRWARESHRLDEIPVEFARDREAWPPADGARGGELA